VASAIIANARPIVPITSTRSHNILEEYV